jgi:hypothetical protein
MLLFEVAEFSTAGMSFFCSPLRQGSCLGLAATANHLARESHMDDLARDATMDSLDFRLKNVLGYKTARCVSGCGEVIRMAWKESQARARCWFGRRNREGRLRSDMAAATLSLAGTTPVRETTKTESRSMGLTRRKNSFLLIRRKSALLPFRST